MSVRQLIVNADDFGYTPGVNRGIVEAHEHGIVTSTSLMVRAPAAAAAAEYARSHSRLGVGLHVDLGEWVFRDGTWVALYEILPEGADAQELEAEVAEQLRLFRELVGREPTHLDSHQHVHRNEPLRAVVLRAGAELRIPVRHESPLVRYLGDFYGQMGTGEPLPELIGPEALIGLLHGLDEGITELGCHPGLDVEGWTSYRTERAVEVATLTDPRVRAAVEREGITLRAFADLPFP